MTKPKISWPQTPADVRRFIGANFVSIKHGEKPEDTRYMVTIHDLLSAFSDWVFFGCEPEPELEPKLGMGISDNPYCNDSDCNEPNSRAMRWHNKLLALDAAKAQPQQEAVGEIKPFNAFRSGAHFYKEIPPVGTKLYTTPQPAQQQKQAQPVAWWNKTKDTVSADPVHRHNSDCQPLYATPPQRQPLTDDQVLDGFCKIPNVHQFIEAFFAGVRFAEAAHGIK